MFSIFSLGEINIGFCQQAVTTGRIQGSLVDAETKESLPFANVIIVNTTMGAATDMDGHFIIENVPVGSYSLKFSFMGYEPLVKTDVIVRSKRITFVNAELRLSVIEMKGVEISGGYFSKVEDQPTSVVNYSYEEIRRAPGSAGDVSRILMSLPSFTFKIS